MVLTKNYASKVCFLGVIGALITSHTPLSFSQPLPSTQAVVTAGEEYEVSATDETIDDELDAPILLMDKASLEQPLSGNEGWFQIDLVIFKQSQIANSSEISPKTSRPSYPLNWTTLKTPADIIDLYEQQQIKEQNELDLEARKARFEEELKREAGFIVSDHEIASDHEIVSGPEATTDIGNQQDVANEEETSSEQNIDDSEPGDIEPGTDSSYEIDTLYSYRLLPKESSTLSELTPYLRWSKNYNTLASLSWQQLVLDKERTQSIALNIGDQYDQHFEIEGSLTIHVARFLHAEFNLWQTTFERNYGQDIETVDLPANPVLINEKPEEPFSISQPLLKPWEQQSNAWSQNSGYQTQYDELLDSDYLPTSVSTLKVSRKLRSNELHYIDHPTFGVILKITPIEIEEMEPETAE